MGVNLAGRTLVGFESKTLNTAIGVIVPIVEDIQGMIENGAKVEPISEYISTVGVIALYPARIMLQGLNKKQQEDLVQELYEFSLRENPDLHPRFTVIRGGLSGDAEEEPEVS